jgi:hypothetical protein
MAVSSLPGNCGGPDQVPVELQQAESCCGPEPFVLPQFCPWQLGGGPLRRTDMIPD